MKSLLPRRLTTIICVSLTTLITLTMSTTAAPLSDYKVTTMPSLAMQRGDSYVVALADSGKTWELDLKYDKPGTCMIQLGSGQLIKASLLKKVPDADYYAACYEIEFIENGKRLWHRRLPTYDNNRFLALRISAGTLSIGNHRLDTDWPLTIDRLPNEITIKAECSLTLMRTVATYPPQLPAITEGFATPGQATATIASIHKPHTALWDYFDQEVDTDYAIAGGDYTLASVDNTDGSIDIIYLSGAAKNADNWQCGMKKGHATPTSIPGRYILEWTDANFAPTFSRAYLSFDGDIMLLIFPYHQAQLRFLRRKS